MDDARRKNLEHQAKLACECHGRTPALSVVH